MSLAPTVARSGGLVAALVALGVLLSSAPVAAKPRPRAAASAPAKGPSRASAPTPAAARSDAKPSDAPAEVAPAPSDAPERHEARPERADHPVAAKKGAGDEGAASVVATEEGKEGVKTYKFGAVEVESRLRSPQLIYFLRRVRAEFDAEGLGHRSFLRELSETRRDPAFR